LHRGRKATVKKATCSFFVMKTVTASDTKASGNEDRRTFAQVVKADMVDYLYFFMPLVIIHNVGWILKPLLTDDTRGPWEIIWHHFLDKADAFGVQDNYWLFVYGTHLVTTIFYWSCALIFLFMDYTQMPAFLMKYKIQQGKNTPPPTAKVIKVLLTVEFNFLMGIPASMLGFSQWEKNANLDLRYVPGAMQTFATLAVCMVCHDFIFYHGHKMLHHKSIYKHIHKKHHEWQAPIAAAAVYSHPVEHFITGIISTSVGLMIMTPQIPVYWIWYMWIGFQVMNDHSGYHFPLFFSPEFHDYHHLKFHTSYGWLSFWDWFWGTDIEFQRTVVHKKRNIRLHTTKSARELVPDEK